MDRAASGRLSALEQPPSGGILPAARMVLDHLHHGGALPGIAPTSSLAHHLGGPGQPGRDGVEEARLCLRPDGYIDGVAALYRSTAHLALSLSGFFAADLRGLRWNRKTGQLSSRPGAIQA